MKKSLEHLPEKKKNELNRAVSIIRDMCDDVEIIILFGSYARGDYKEDSDLSPVRKSGAPSDYDILVVCQHKSSVAHNLLWDSISKNCNGLDPTVPFRIIIHDIKYIKQRLKEIHYFFSDIIKEGCILYTAGNYELKIGKELTPEEQFKVAQEHFEHWFEGASVSFKHHKYAMADCNFKKAAFELHQAAEASYKALLLVFSNYSPYDHFLASMSRQAYEILPEMENIFPSSTETNKELFKLFDYAYIGARYDPDFKISKKDLGYLSGRVKLLLELTEQLCNEKLKALKSTKTARDRSDSAK